MHPNTHYLATFVYQRLGQQFGNLLLAGYKAEPSPKKRLINFIEREGGIEIEWVIELVADTLPCRDEPLVLAALLKLLLRQPDPPANLEFQMEELIEELQWSNSPLIHKRVDRIISNYVKLLYDKRKLTKRDRYKREGTQWGYFHLLTGYIKESTFNASESLPVRVHRNVSFDNSFVEGLKNGQVRFAGINLGPFHKGGC
jgi:hypothetical protein